MRAHALVPAFVCLIFAGDARSDPPQPSGVPGAARNQLDWSRLRVGSALARAPLPGPRESPGAFQEWAFDFRRGLSSLFVSWRIPQTVTGESEEGWFVWFDRKRNTSRVLHLHRGVPTGEGDAWADEDGRMVVEYPVEDAGGNLRWTERVQFGALGDNERYDVVRTFRRPDGAATSSQTTQLIPVPPSAVETR